MISHQFQYLLLLAVGAVPSPFDCYLANRGIRTLHVRMKQHAHNAMKIAQYLESSPLVEQTIYPGIITYVLYIDYIYYI